MFEEIEDLIGSKFGHLTVLSVARISKRKPFYDCLCLCGGHIEHTQRQLISGRYKTCGCKAHKFLVAEGSDSKAFTQLIGNLKKSARLRSIEWKLSNEAVVVLARSDCWYCGKPPSNRLCNFRKKFILAYSGIDRKDPSAGYCSDNVVACCADCNYAKSDMPVASFLSMAERIYRQHFTKHA